MVVTGQLCYLNYNNAYQRVIKQTPNQASSDDQANQDTVATNIKSNAKQSTHLEPKPAEVGDKVRVKQNTDGNLKFSREIYEVTKVTKPKTEYTGETYSLKNMD